MILVLFTGASVYKSFCVCGKSVGEPELCWTRQRDTYSQIFRLHSNFLMLATLLKAVMSIIWAEHLIYFRASETLIATFERPPPNRDHPKHKSLDTVLSDAHNHFPVSEMFWNSNFNWIYIFRFRFRNYFLLGWIQLNPITSKNQKQIRTTNRNCNIIKLLRSSTLHKFKL